MEVSSPPPSSPLPLIPIPIADRVEAVLARLASNHPDSAPPAPADTSEVRSSEAPIPPRSGSIASGDRQEDRGPNNEYLSSQCDERLAAFSRDVNHLASRQLSDAEWDEFENRLDRLVEELALLDPSRRPPNNLNNCRRRRRNRRGNPTSHSQPNRSVAPAPRRSALSQSFPTSPSREDLSEAAEEDGSSSPPLRPRRRNRWAAEARKNQRLYRVNKAKCIRSIIGEKSPSCPISVSRLQSYFDQPPSSLNATLPGWLEGALPTPNTSDELTSPVAKQEVELQLKRLPWQSSPGPDGVAYRVWKSAPSSPDVLSMVYSVCLSNCRFPTSWKSSRTVFIFKKGDQQDPRNWQPISLQNTIYKVFAAVMARRLASYAIREKKISSTQKGFLPTDGCAEHTFLMESLLSDSKRRRKTLRIAWLDLCNAFGSIPHDLLWEMMDRLQIPSPFTALCREIYNDSHQQVLCEEGITPAIPLRTGIKQGCPLSPLLFNLALEALLPALNSTGSGYTLDNGTTIRQLAYADDVCLFGSSQEDISRMLSIVHEFGVWSGLKLNVQKCGCLSVINNSSRGRYVEAFSPSYGDQAIPSLKWEESYRYLGISFGRPRQGSNDELSASVLDVAEKILSSKLTEWQKVEAVNMFAVSKTDHFLHTSSANSSWADSLDSRIRKLVKKHLRLPVRTNCAFLHLSARRGGLGLRSISRAWDRATITRAIKSLSSSDRTVSDVAWAQLRATIQKNGNPSDLG